MGSGLVHIIGREIIRQMPQVDAIGFDLDGTLTDLHRDEIQNLIGDRTLDALPADLKRALGNIKYADLKKRAKVSVGWYIDLKNGYLLQPNTEGKVIKAREGKEELPDVVVKEEYGEKIEMPFTLEMDRQKPRFLPICDGFDYVEGVITAALAVHSGLPRRKTLADIAAAVRRSHDHVEEGFKGEMLRNPARYGIQPNDDLIRFLNHLKSKGKRLFLLTAAKKEYAFRLLEMLGIGGNNYFERTGKMYFDEVITGITKPACFYDDGNKSNSRLKKALRRMKIFSPNKVLYIGDHLYKDIISARSAGFRTCLRMPRTHIDTVVNKLSKYCGVGFRIDNNLRIAAGRPSEQLLPQLGNYYYLLSQYAHMAVPKLHYLAPMFH